MDLEEQKIKNKKFEMKNGRTDKGTGKKSRLAFKLAAVLIPVVLVFAAEGVARLAWTEDAPAPSTPGGWGKGALVVTPRTRQQLLEPVRDAAGKVTAVRTGRRMVRDHFMHDLSWTPQPAPGTFRVFCFGGSATHGVPFERKKGVPFPDRLQHYLRAAGLQAEVINLGGASFGSDQVLELVKAALEYRPSALVVYSANNEFFNYHLELVELNRAWVPRKLEKIKLLALARRALGRSDAAAPKPEPRRKDPPPKDAPRGGPPEQDAHVQRQEKLVADIMADTLARAEASVKKTGERYQRADAHHEAVVQRYEANLSAMAKMAAASKVKLIIAKVPANLMAKPTLSLPRPGRAAAGDPWYAETHYKRGVERLGRRDSRAVTDLRNALELDMNPGRPVLAMDRVVMRVTARTEALMVDLEPAFGTGKDPTRCRDYFHDTCHLTAKGYDVLAREVAKVLVK